MLESILDNFHERVCRLERDFFVKVNLENGDYHVQKNVMWRGFMAGCLTLKLQNGKLKSIYTVVALSSDKSIDLNFLNEELKNRESPICRQLNSWNKGENDFDAHNAQLVVNEKWGQPITVYMIKMPVLEKTFTSNSKKYGFGYVSIESNI